MSVSCMKKLNGLDSLIHLEVSTADEQIYLDALPGLQMLQRGINLVQVAMAAPLNRNLHYTCSSEDFQEIEGCPTHLLLVNFMQGLQETLPSTTAYIQTTAAGRRLRLGIRHCRCHL